MKRSRWDDLPIKAASLVYFDIETTGLRPDRGAQITEMAVADHKQVRFSWKREDCDALPLPAPLPRLLNLLRADVVVMTPFTRG